MSTKGLYSHGSIFDVLEESLDIEFPRHFRTKEHLQLQTYQRCKFQFIDGKYVLVSYKCLKCNEFKPTDHFGIDNNSPVGIHSICKNHYRKENDKDSQIVMLRDQVSTLAQQLNALLEKLGEK